MVEERGELFLLPLLAASRTRQRWVTRAGSAPVRALLIAFPLSRPWLHRLATGRPALFVGFVATMRSQTSLGRASAATLLTSRYGPSNQQAYGDPEISRFPHKERPYMPGSQTTPGPTPLAITRPPILPSSSEQRRHPVDNDFAAQWLAIRSLPTLRRRPRGRLRTDRATWIATPSSQ